MLRLLKHSQSHLLAPVARVRRRLSFEPLESRRLLASFAVTNLADSGLGSLRQAILDANANPGPDDIHFESSATSGTLQLTTGHIVIAEEVTIGGPGAAAFSIDAQQLSRHFLVGPEAGDVVISGLTLTQGKSPDGESGGAILSQSTGHVEIRNSIIELSSTDDDGGGVASIEGDVTIRSSTVRSNSAGDEGGGIHAANVTIIASEILNNQSVDFAGGVLGLSVDVAGSTISSNISQNDGGGVFGLTVELTNSTVDRNTAAQRGGGVFAFSLAATNSTISGNMADQGGGIFAANADLLFATVAANSARVGGGVHADDDYELMLDHTIVATNTATASNPDLREGASTSITNSVLGDAAGTTLAATPSSSQDSDGNLIGRSDGSGLIDPLLDSLKNNGGATKTHALLADSPAIDIGNNVSTTIPRLDNDQRGEGFDRIIDGNGDETATVDIGAFEFVMRIEELDFGDAPAASQSGFRADYPVTLEQDGARHAVSHLFLGIGIDTEVNGQPGNDAGQDGSTGDDGDGGDDEDGVLHAASLVSTSTRTTGASVTVNASGTGKLDAWIDFNQDGDWADEEEQILASADVVAGVNLLSFEIPAAASVGDTFARFRLSSTGSLSPTGAANDGEVEDYVITILDGSAASGAHAIVTPPQSGTLVVTIDGDDVLVLAGTTELFRAPGPSLAGLAIMGTAGDDTLNLHNLAGTFDGLVTGNAGQGSDTLRLLGSGHSLNLTSIADADLQGFETLDIAGDGDNELSLTVDEVVNISASTDTLRIVHDKGDTINYGADWSVRLPQLIANQFVHVLEQGNAKIEVLNSTPFRNPFRPLDSNRDGVVSPLDALVTINRLNANASTALPTPMVDDDLIDFFYYDSSGDGFVSPLDVLIVINFLNSPAGQSEGEFTPWLPSTVNQQKHALASLGSKSNTETVKLAQPFDYRSSSGASKAAVEPPTSLPSRAGDASEELLASIDEFFAGFDSDLR